MRSSLRQKLLTEAPKRDHALNLFETHRSDLLDAARDVAASLVGKNGRVTAPEVLEELRLRGFGLALDSFDRRFMGGVFRAGSGWERVGYENRGSHCRPVSVWRRRVGA